MNRKGTNCYKWDLVDFLYKGEDLLPMWVADMDFACPKEVTEAIIERAKHPIYGYTYLDRDYARTVIDFMKRRHNLDVPKSYFVLCNGVLQAMTQLIQLYTNEGDKIIIHDPVYSMFKSIINNNNRSVLSVPMIKEGTNFVLDLSALEEAMKESKMMLFCNPHNPIGKVYSQEDVEAVYHLAKKHDVLLIADEIHADLVIEEGKRHVSMLEFAHESDRLVVCQAPSKTFNIAGFHISNIFIPNEDIRDRFKKRIAVENHSQIASPIGITAAKAAYEKGDAWLDEIHEKIRENYQYTLKFLQEHLPFIKASRLEGTYLLWLTFDTELDHDQVANALVTKGKLALGNGLDYGEETGNKCFRMNIATDRETLEEGLRRLQRTFEV